MKRDRIYAILGLLLCCLTQFTLQAQEKVFAQYFDIPVNSPEGTEVIGRIHLERNKDILTQPIPKGYHFEIVEQGNEQLFYLDTQYDLSNRIMGVFIVGRGKMTNSHPTSHQLTVALKDGHKVLNTFTVQIKVVEKTLWSIFYERFTPSTIKNKLMYGRIKYTDSEVASKILELKQHNGKFEGYKSYTSHPQDYEGKFDPLNPFLPTGTIEYDWLEIAKKIGGLGYAYATSSLYGPQGSPIQRKELREALFSALLAYMQSVPVEGGDVLVEGKPIGQYTGDGFSMLSTHKWAGSEYPTHQWDLIDPLIVPILHLMPEILEGVRKHDKTCTKLHNELIRYCQLFMALIPQRRVIDNPKGRWGEIQDTLYSSGAWTDANLGHRSRTMQALPIIWADYNRPMTYVQYWYSDFYQDKPFKNFSLLPGCSPQGVVTNVSHWMTKYYVPTHTYIQSGYQPDGTISHHIANATDVAMAAYGFEWLTDCNSGYDYFKNTDFRIADKHYQAELDWLLKVYPKMFYKQRLDFLVAGRSFLSDLHLFVTKIYQDAVNDMLKACSKDTKLTGLTELKDVCRRLKANTYEYSGTDAYWVNEFLIHRRGENEQPFYASLKLKSERTVGAEDFNKVRKAWHLGYGILQVKIQGDEYSEHVLSNYDWHAIPGLTEEWRTDAIPVGHAQASLPGLNKVSGVLADGKAGMGIYHHLPQETYSSATAFKSYHFIEDKIIASGSGIARQHTGQGNEITTFIDQSVFNEQLTWCAGSKIHTVKPGQSVNLTEKINSVCWLHHGQKGYIVLPINKLSLRIVTGKEVKITDPAIANDTPNFILAIGHGTEPGTEWDNKYYYIQLPNVSCEEMPRRVKTLLKDVQFAMQDSTAHAVYSVANKTWQYAFFKPTSISVGGIEIKSDDVAQIMLRDNGEEWILSVNNPMPDKEKRTLTFSISANLPKGTYSYQTRGVYPLEGETVIVEHEGKAKRITVQLPDSRDTTKYNYQSDLYAATPIVITLPKNIINN